MPKIICQVCNETFRKTSCFSEHFMLCHTSFQIEESNQTISECKIIKPKLVHKTELQGEINPSNHRFKFKNTDGAKVPYGRCVYDCEICYKQVSYSGFAKHVFRHCGTLPYFCCLCDFYTISKLHLQDHVSRHDLKSKYAGLGPSLYGCLHKCTFCDSSYSSIHELANHYLMHLKDMPFGCKICEVKFSEEKNLIIHNHIHKSTVQCDICYSIFHDRGQCLLHVLSHNKSIFFNKFLPLLSGYNLNMPKYGELDINSDNEDNIDCLNENGNCLETSEQPKNNVRCFIDSNPENVQEFEQENVSHLCEASVKKGNVDYISDLSKRSTNNSQSEYENKLQSLSKTLFNNKRKCPDVFVADYIKKHKLNDFSVVLEKLSKDNQWLKSHEIDKVKTLKLQSNEKVLPKNKNDASMRQKYTENLKNISSFQLRKSLNHQAISFPFDTVSHINQASHKTCIQSQNSSKHHVNICDNHVPHSNLSSKSSVISDHEPLYEGSQKQGLFIDNKEQRNPRSVLKRGPFLVKKSFKTSTGEIQTRLLLSSDVDEQSFFKTSRLQKNSGDSGIQLQNNSVSLLKNLFHKNIIGYQELQNGLRKNQQERNPRSFLKCSFMKKQEVKNDTFPNQSTSTESKTIVHSMESSKEFIFKELALQPDIKTEMTDKVKKILLFARNKLKNHLTM